MEEALEDNRHSSILGPFIDRCLRAAGIAPAGLDAISVSAGPGSYTGLRVGASTAKGLCYALDIPLIAVDTLEAAALAAASDHHDADWILPMIDARRMEVYTATFDGQGQRRSDNQALVLSENVFNHLLTSGKKVVLCGNGTQKAKTLFNDDSMVFDTSIIHSARHLAKPARYAFQHGNFADIHQFVPAYLKPPNITTPKKSII